MNFIKTFFNWLTKGNRLKPVLQEINKIGIHDYLLGGDAIRLFLGMVQPCDVILIHRFGEATSLGGSRSSHAAMASYNYSNKIYDATGDKGFALRDILNLTTGINRIKILRPKIPKADLSRIESIALAWVARGVKYDWSFEPGKDLAYCSEAIAHIMNEYQADGPGVFILMKK